jgi:hypothetical protein
MIKKRGRGGARKGAGRKPGSALLPWVDRLWIGSLCEQMQANWQNRATLTEYQKQPGARSTLRAQTLVRGRRLIDGRDISRAFEVAQGFGLDLEEEKAWVELRDRRPIRGVVQIAVRRGRARDQICMAVSAICKRIRKWTVRPSSVDVYWNEYRVFVERSHIDGEAEVISDAEIFTLQTSE